MSTWKKLLFAGLCVILLGVVLIALLPRPSLYSVSPPEPLKENSLSFLTDIIGFNLTEYKIVNSNYVPSTCLVGYNGLPLVTISYDLQSSENKVQAYLNYAKENNSYTLETCSYIYLNSTAFVYPPYPTDNLLNWTRGFLKGTRAFKAIKPYISEMRKTLDTVEHLEPLNVTCGNTELQIIIRQFTEDDIYTTLTFLYTSEGVNNTTKAVVFDFHNGLYVNFADHLNQAKVGN